MKRWIGFAVMCFLLVGCGGKLDEGYDKDQLKEKAMEVITYLNNESYDDISLMGDDQMKDPQLPKTLKEAWSPALEKYGSFVDYDTFDYTSKDGFAVVIVVASYEHNKVQFTISFNQDLQLSGLYFK